MELNLFVKELFSKAQEEGFSEYEVYYVDRESLSISVYKEEVEKYNLNNSAGLSFRGKFGDRIGYSYTEILDEDAIEMLVKKAKENVLAIENNDIQFIYEGDKEYKEISTYHEELEDIPADKLINIAISMEKEAKKYCNKVESFSGCSVSYSSGKYGIINSKGLNLSNKSNLLTAYVVPIVKDLDKMYDGCGYVVAKSLNDVKPDKIAKMGVDEALSKIGGTSIASGNYKVIINNEAMVSLLSTFAGIFSGDAVQKGLSLLKDKEGEIIAADIVNLVDDPHLEDGLASVSFDDEGVATLKTYLIKNGKLNSLLHNLKTANKAGVKSTGNGFKSSYASPISVSPTNFYIEPGINSLEEMTKKINKGLIITDFAGLHSGANSITGDFSLAAKGFYIEDGIKTHPVEQITVAGNFFTLLNNIEEIGSDLKFPMSSVGSPSIVIKDYKALGGLYKLNTRVLEVNRDKIITYVNPEEGIVEIEAKAIILAAGCRERYTGNILIPIHKFTGIFTVGAAHRLINYSGYIPGKEVIISGDDIWTLIVARRLVIEGATIKGIVTQRKSFNRNELDIVNGFNIPIIYESEISDIEGGERVNLCRIKNLYSYEITTIPCDSLVLSVGYFPDIDFIKKMSIMMDGDYIKSENNHTSVEGIFICGTMKDGIDSLLNSGESGFKLGNQIFEYLKESY